MRTSNLTQGGKRVAPVRSQMARGMTLFELLLVLVLLAVICSLAQPVFDGAFASVRLKRASDQVLAAWSELRTQAILSGKPHQFTFEPDSGTYRLAPWRRNSLETNDPNYAAEEVASGDWQPRKAALPEAILFVSGDVKTEEAESGSVTQSLNSSQSTEESGPIVFYPDGSSTDATLELKNERAFVQRLTLRGLSGIGRASEIMTKRELDRKQVR